MLELLIERAVWRFNCVRSFASVSLSLLLKHASMHHLRADDLCGHFVNVTLEYGGRACVRASERRPTPDMRGWSYTAD